MGPLSSGLEYNSVPGECVEKLSSSPLGFHGFVAKQYLFSHVGRSLLYWPVVIAKYKAEAIKRGRLYVGSWFQSNFSLPSREGTAEGQTNGKCSRRGSHGNRPENRVAHTIVNSMQRPVAGTRDGADP